MNHYTTCDMKRIDITFLSRLQVKKHNAANGKKTSSKHGTSLRFTLLLTLLLASVGTKVADYVLVCSLQHNLLSCS